MTLRALLLALLLALPFAADAATAQTTSFTVMRMERVGDDLTIGLRANEPMTNVRIALVVGETVVGIPEREDASWPAGETRNVVFELLKPVDTATLRFRWHHQNGIDVTRTTDIYVPPPRASSSDPPRVVVTDATLDGGALSVQVSNVGGGRTGLLLVSVEDSQQRKIGSPYYRTFDSLAPSSGVTAEFAVAEGTTELVAALEYANRTDRIPVKVRAADGGDGGGEGAAGPVNVTLSTDLPFREVDLGRTVDFGLTVRNGGRLALVQLDVDGLPAGYSGRFFVGGSAVPSLYLDRNQTRTVTLSITVPNNAAEVDRTIDFSTAARVNGTEAGRIPMGLAVRGVGQLEISTTDTFPKIAPGALARGTVTIRNAGTAPLFDVELDARRPYGWSIRYEPSRLDRLDPGATAQVTVEVRAPDIISGGEYSADVQARSGDVSSRWTTLALSVEADEGGSGAWLWLLFLGLIGGTLGFGAWRKWRG
jgi:hypothetical protein